MLEDWWPASCRKAWGGTHFPRDFAVLDVETTGFHAKEDVIVQIGCCRVAGGAVDWAREVYVDWTNEPEAPQLEARFAKQAAEMAAAVTIEETKGGLSPRDAARKLAKTLRGFDKAGLPLVGHNIHRFDFPRLQSFLLRYDGYNLNTYSRPILCTAALVVALEARDPLARPDEGESLDRWSFRVLSRYRAKTKYSLHEACVPRYSVSTDDLPGRPHRAAYDAALTARLLFALEHHDWSAPTAPPAEHDLADLDRQIEAAEKKRKPTTPSVAGPPKRWRGTRPN
jgi:DNA polymerase III epsilon subunit-like protein